MGGDNRRSEALTALLGATAVNTARVRAFEKMWKTR
jgi:hypothetical protein